MQRIKPITSGVYHIYNRGVDKRNIFMDERDYVRFIHDLYEFNDSAPAGKVLKIQKSEVEPPTFVNVKKDVPRKFLVNILAFCLMPNHFHLMVRQVVENGVIEFMRKIGTGYTYYFNQRYERSGALLQGRYKSVHLTDDAHFLHLPYYIHMNPLDLAAPEWRERKLSNPKQAIKFLENYRWSSYLDYIGKHNFPSVTQREFLLQFFDGTKKYQDATIAWLKELNTTNIGHLTLE